MSRTLRMNGLIYLKVQTSLTYDCTQLIVRWVRLKVGSEGRGDRCHSDIAFRVVLDK